MQIEYIEGFTRVLGESQGYIPLPIKDIKFVDGTPAMESQWTPSAEERALIASGQPILGGDHPPVMLTVDPIVRTLRQRIDDFRNRFTERKVSG